MKATFILFLSAILFSIAGSSQTADSINRLNTISITGLKANQKISSTLSSKNHLSAKSFILPAIFIGYGFTSLGNNSFKQLNKNISYEVKEDMPGFKTTVDDYLKYAPVVSTYALNIAGVKGRHRLLDRTIVYTVSSILTNQVVTSLKNATHQLRPDSSTYNSFPSGHTATAFVGAEFMNHELGWHSSWYSVAGYTMAGATGVLRIANNRHWLGDVIAGAGIGMLTTKFSYWVYSKVENKFHKKTTPLY
jgi:membrane-associated phospholipid phosphatase